MSQQLLEGHTVRRYDGELNTLHLRVLEMGGLVLNQTKLALCGLTEGDLKATSDVLEYEHDVDEIEIQTDEEIINVLAKRQPMAGDLRVIMSISKAITDLERIGDEAARVAEIGKSMHGNERSKPGSQLLRDVTTMGDLAIGKLEEALHCFDALDIERALKLAAGKSELDMEFQSSLRRLATFLLEDARNVGYHINIVLAIKSLERIGDLSRNLAEYVVYMLSGKDIRHTNGNSNAAAATTNE